MKRVTPLLLAIAVCTCWAGCAFLNRYQKEGDLSIPGLNQPVTIMRDEKGMAYIYAQNVDDAILAQGFVSAQDRLFQMELNRRFAGGRFSEFAGEETRDLDVRLFVIWPAECDAGHLSGLLLTKSHPWHGIGPFVHPSSGLPSGGILRRSVEGGPR